MWAKTEITEAKSNGYTWGATNFLNNNKVEYTAELHHGVFSISAGREWILDLTKKKK